MCIDMTDLIYLAVKQQMWKKSMGLVRTFTKCVQLWPLVGISKLSTFNRLMKYQLRLQEYSGQEENEEVALGQLGTFSSLHGNSHRARAMAQGYVSRVGNTYGSMMIIVVYLSWSCLYFIQIVQRVKLDGLFSGEDRFYVRSASKGDGTTVFSGGCDKQVKMRRLTVAMRDGPLKMFLVLDVSS